MITNMIYAPQYMEEFFNLLFGYYIYTQPAVYATYLSIDKENSIYDKKILSDYSLTGDNIYSGIKFKALHYIPVLFSESPQRPTTNDSQSGYNSQDISLSATIPYFGDGFEPNPNDIVIITPYLKDEEKVFRVVDYEYANISHIKNSNHNALRLTMKPAPIDLEQAYSSISDEYAFYLPSRRFIDINSFNNIMVILDILKDCRLKITQNYSSVEFSYYDKILTPANAVEKLYYKTLNKIFVLYSNYLSADLNILQFKRADLEIISNPRANDKLYQLLSNITEDDIVNFIYNINNMINESQLSDQSNTEAYTYFHKIFIDDNITSIRWIYSLSNPDLFETYGENMTIDNLPLLSLLHTYVSDAIKSQITYNETVELSYFENFISNQDNLNLLRNPNNVFEALLTIYIMFRGFNLVLKHVKYPI